MLDAETVRGYLIYIYILLFSWEKRRWRAVEVSKKWANEGLHG